MLLENKIIIIIHEYNKLNCSHIKGLMIYLKLKPLLNNLILIEYNKIINIYENKKFIEKKIEFKDNKMLFIKLLPDIKILKKLKDNNNIIYHEIIDFFYNKKYKNYDEYFNYYTYNKKFIFDKIIVNSNHMKNKLINNINNIDVIYHQYDKRINLNNKIINKVYYFGLRDKLELSEDIIKNNNIQIINYNGIKKYIQSAYTCIHICFLFNNNILYDTYTSTKLATAIITNSIFICNKIPVFVELLGDNYEFYCEHENELCKIIEKAKNLLNNKEEYLKFLEKYNYLKIKLSYQEILKDYKLLFK